MVALYPGTCKPSPAPEKAVACLEAELQEWLRVTPEFFHPKGECASNRDDTFYDVPWIFRRQQRTIQGAFYFANMLLYRGYLLREFLQQSPNTPRTDNCPLQVQKCVDNAMNMIQLAAGFGAEESGYNSTFWVSRHLILHKR